MVRGKPRVDAILSASIGLLEEVGYEAMTIDAVAARAHSSKATIYRRWQSKAQLVKAALDQLDAEHNRVIPETGTLRSDLIAVALSIKGRATPAHVAMMHGVALAARSDPELAQLLRSHVQDEALSPFQVVLTRAIERKWLPARTNAVLIHDVAEAMVLRQLQLGAPLNRAFVLRLVDQVILPLLGKDKKRG
ncbi:MAG: TetR/AcrR family transcriptional regulator [Polyangiaceae bacterium]